MPRRSLVIAAAALALSMNALGCNGASLVSAQARKCAGAGKCPLPDRSEDCCKACPSGVSQSLRLEAKVSVPAPVPFASPLPPIAAQPLFSALAIPGALLSNAQSPPAFSTAPPLPLRI